MGKLVTCPLCNGSRLVPTDAGGKTVYISCYVCGGTGKVSSDDPPEPRYKQGVALDKKR